MERIWIDDALSKGEILKNKYSDYPDTPDVIEQWKKEVDDWIGSFRDELDKDSFAFQECNLDWNSIMSESKAVVQGVIQRIMDVLKGLL